MKSAHHIHLHLHIRISVPINSSLLLHVSVELITLILSAAITRSLLKKKNNNNNNNNWICPCPIPYSELQMYTLQIYLKGTGNNLIWVPFFMARGVSMATTYWQVLFSKFRIVFCFLRVCLWEDQAKGDTTKITFSDLNSPQMLGLVSEWLWQRQ